MARQPSVMKHQFSQVPRAEIQRSTFDRSHGCKTTFNSGWLVPILVDEALPGDTFNIDLSAFGRLATPIHPFMDNLMIETFFFAVPNRLIWDNWEKFNGAQDNPGDSTDFLVPVVSVGPSGYLPDGGNPVSLLGDYFGLPTQVGNFDHSALFGRAYNLIWNEWFRDQNLQNSVTVERGDGPDSTSTYALLKRGKRHDYFTSCLPWPQKGPAVPLPLTGNAPVIPDGANQPKFKVGAQTDRALTFTAGSSNAGWSTTNTAAGNADWDVTALQADLGAVTAATINELRQSFQIQKLYERDARGGTRYTEIIKSHFGVTSPDARLQRPEYLGGGTSPINVNPVAQTSSTDATTPQGNLAAMGTFNFGGGRHGFTKSFTEHCVIIGLVSVRADLTYQQGLNRMWSRSTRWDYYWPALSHIGEQAVLSKEIFMDGTASDENVFGYQERYAEYRYKPSQITGRFRSNAAASLDTWHLAQDFASRPVLGSTFIEENPPIDRVIAVPTEPEILFDGYFRYRCARPMPVYSVPGLIDHF